MKIPLVYCIVLNWNCAPDTLACVEELQKQDYSNFKILIVDNSSTDDSEKILKGRFPQHSFVQTNKNKGYAGGNNDGIKYAVRSGADYVWILNPDTRVKPDSLEIMIREMEADPSLGVAGPVIVEYEKSEDTPLEVFGWKIIEKTGWGAEKIINPDHVLQADYVYGCSFLMRVRMILQIGLFREDFFMYSEEKEFCLRARKKNWKIRIIENTQNTHYHYGENPAGAFYTCRNEIFISRIEHKRRLRTLKHQLNAELFHRFLFQGRVREALFQLKKAVTKNGQAILAGIFTPLHHPPTLEQAA